MSFFGIFNRPPAPPKAIVLMNVTTRPNRHQRRGKSRKGHQLAGAPVAQQLSSQGIDFSRLFD